MIFNFTVKWFHVIIISWNCYKKNAQKVVA